MPDVDVRVFNERAMNRISRVVRFIESSGFEEGGDPFLGRATAGQVTALVDADIEHHEIGLCKRATGADFAAVVAPGLDIDGVFNPMLKVWEGSRVLLKRGVLAGALAGEGNRWVIAQAFSATRIRGQLTADIAPGGSATMSSITPINGTFNPASTTVFMPASGTALSLGDYAYADLVWTGVNSEWQLDNRAPGSGNGGPFTRSMLSVWTENAGLVADSGANVLVPLQQPVSEGSVAGVSWDSNNHVLSLATGEYVLTYDYNAQATLNESFQDRYPAGHVDEGHMVIGSFRVTLRDVGGANIVSGSTTDGAVMWRTNTEGAGMNTNAGRTVRIDNPGPATITRQFWLNRPFGNMPDDARVQIIGFGFHIEKIS